MSGPEAHHAPYTNEMNLDISRKCILEMFCHALLLGIVRSTRILRVGTSVTRLVP